METLKDCQEEHPWPLGWLAVGIHQHRDYSLPSYDAHSEMLSLHEETRSLHHDGQQCLHLQGCSMKAHQTCLEEENKKIIKATKL